VIVWWERTKAFLRSLSPFPKWFNIEQGSVQLCATASCVRHASPNPLLSYMLSAMSRDVKHNNQSEFIARVRNFPHLWLS
jgi:hypothetical protein